MKLNDKLPSDFALNCNLRHYPMAVRVVTAEMKRVAGDMSPVQISRTLVGQCRLTPGFHN